MRIHTLKPSPSVLIFGHNHTASQDMTSAMDHACWNSSQSIVPSEFTAQGRNVKTQHHKTSNSNRHCYVCLRKHTIHSTDVFDIMHTAISTHTVHRAHTVHSTHTPRSTHLGDIAATVYSTHKIHSSKVDHSADLGRSLVDCEDGDLVVLNLYRKFSDDSS